MKGLNIKDIAKEAGVSIATISRALNPQTQHLLNPETFKRIKALTEKLGYLPNRAASSLRQGIAKTIGFPMNFRSDTTSGYVGEILKGVLKGLYETGYDLKLISQEGIYSLQSLLDNAGVDGLIITHAYYIAYPHLKDELEKSKIFPLVVMNDYQSDWGINQLYVDSYKATYDLTEYVIKKDNRDFFLLGGEMHSLDAQIRRKAFLEVLSKNNIKFPENRFLNGHFNEVGGYAAILELIRKEPDFRGVIFCLNDAMAVGVLRAFGELGLRCPQDIKVVGFDNITITEHTNPPLTTVSVPLAEMGYEAVYMIHKILKGEIKQYIKKEFSHELIIRVSC